ncbi:MAG: sulfite oxidase heme-binding subunit YedZ [Anaerolineae bacterium]
MRELGQWLRKRWIRIVANLGALVPLLTLVWTYAAGRYVIDPVTEIMVRTGRLAVTFLLLSLACTPVAVVTGFSRILQARRPLGLWSLGYATLHFLTFAGWDYRFDLSLLRIGIFDQPFVIVGLGAFLFLVGLGVTSLPALRERMGRSWRWFQRLVYLAAALDIWHILWLKKDPWEAWRYPVILAVLLILRIPHIRRGMARVRKRLFR